MYTACRKLKSCERKKKWMQKKFTKGIKYFRKGNQGIEPLGLCNQLAASCFVNIQWNIKKIILNLCISYSDGMCKY